MKSLVAAVALLSIASSAVAGPAIDLQPLNGRGVSIDSTENIAGSCGGAVVRVVGVTKTHAPFYQTGLDGKIVIIPGPPHNGPHKQFVLDSHNGLSDYMGTSCVSTPKGARLMVWTMCGGSACGDHWSFFIIDPNGLKMFPANYLKTDCNAACASKIIGSHKPFDIDANNGAG